jgi:hypothetical protein
MDATSARATLHGWITDADDATVISLAELLASLTVRGLLSKTESQPGTPFPLKIGDAPKPSQTPAEWWADAAQRREEADHQARDASIARMRQSAEERASKVLPPDKSDN